MVDQNLLDNCESEHDIAMSGEAVKYVYLLWAGGDYDYHSNRVPGVYATLEAAQKAMIELPNCTSHGVQESCPDESGCTFFYNYSIEKLEVKS